MHAKTIFFQVDLRREMLGELISLYYTTFLVSVRSLNVTKDIYQMEELFIEIENHIMWVKLESHRPALVVDFIPQYFLEDLFSQNVIQQGAKDRQLDDLINCWQSRWFLEEFTHKIKF